MAAPKRPNTKAATEASVAGRRRGKHARMATELHAAGWTVIPPDTCPDVCPACGVDLKSDGYPLGHQTDEGDVCTFTWAGAS